ncbi:MAG: outer membrane protein assembly factor BamD [Terriglobia bacterium]
MSRAPLHLIVAALLVALVSTACHRHKHAGPDLSASQEPDRVLYEKSLEDITNKRFQVARLTLQTLLNAYPDSDYLDRAKLAIADAWYQEGGKTGLTQAEIEYKDFITFFPNSPHAAYAQYQAAMCHYRQLEKPDRDRTHVRRAEREFQLLLKNFHDSEYIDDGALKLKEVQEVLAESEYRVGRFYFIKQSYVAAASRLEAMIARYPNYSQRDDALWMTARSFQKMGLLPNPERAAFYHSLLVEEFPLSGHAEDAKKALAALGKPIPEPSPEVLARAQQRKALLAQHRRGLLGRMLGILSSKPDTSPARATPGPPVLDTEERKPPPASPEEIEAQRKILVARMAAANPNVAGSNKGKKAGKGGNADGKKKGFWRVLVPFW